MYGILSVQLLFTFLTASVFKWSSVITYIVQTKSVVVQFYTNYESTKLLKMFTFVGSEMQMQIIFLSITLSKKTRFGRYMNSEGIKIMLTQDFNQTQDQ